MIKRISHLHSKVYKLLPANRQLIHRYLGSRPFRKIEKVLAGIQYHNSSSEKTPQHTGLEQYMLYIDSRKLEISGALEHCDFSISSLQSLQSVVNTAGLEQVFLLFYDM